MAEPAPESERYLAAVERQLPFAQDERAEILDELRAHLADSAAALQEAGMDPADAERIAVERLGPAKRLADELARARRDTTRLLAAAGAGVWGALSGAAYGGIVGLGFALVATVAATAVMTAEVYQLGGTFGVDEATRSSIVIMAIGMAVFGAGRVLTPTVAARAGFAAATVRRLTVPLGAALLLVFALVGWSGALDWLGVIALLALPLWWAAGAWQTREIRLGVPVRLVKALLVALVVAFLATIPAGATFPWSVSYAEPKTGQLPLIPDYGFSRIAAPIPAAVEADRVITIVSGDHTNMIESVLFPSRASLDGWHDLRVEAWRNDLAGNVVDQAETEPLATGPAQWSSGAVTPDGLDMAAYLSSSGEQPLPPSVATLSGSVRVDHWPGIQAVFVALTGIAPDGRRYLVGDPGSATVYFNGTALDWFAGVLAGH